MQNKIIGRFPPLTKRKKSHYGKALTVLSCKRVPPHFLLYPTKPKILHSRTRGRRGGETKSVEMLSTRVSVSLMPESIISQKDNHSSTIPHDLLMDDVKAK